MGILANLLLRQMNKSNNGILLLNSSIKEYEFKTKILKLIRDSEIDLSFDLAEELFIYQNMRWKISEGMLKYGDFYSNNGLAYGIYRRFQIKAFLFNVEVFDEYLMFCHKVKELLNTNHNKITPFYRTILAKEYLIDGKKFKANSLRNLNFTIEDNKASCFLKFSCDNQSSDIFEEDIEAKIDLKFDIDNDMLELPNDFTLVPL